MGNFSPVRNFLARLGGGGENFVRITWGISSGLQYQPRRKIWNCAKRESAESNGAQNVRPSSLFSRAKLHEIFSDFSARLPSKKILPLFFNPGKYFQPWLSWIFGLNLSPCNRQFDFKWNFFRSRAEISARLTGLKLQTGLQSPYNQAFKYKFEIIS